MAVNNGEEARRVWSIAQYQRANDLWMHYSGIAHQTFPAMVTFVAMVLSLDILYIGKYDFGRWFGLNAACVAVFVLDVLLYRCQQSMTRLANLMNKLEPDFLVHRGAVSRISMGHLERPHGLTSSSAPPRSSDQLDEAAARIGFAYFFIGLLLALVLATAGLAAILGH